MCYEKSDSWIEALPFVMLGLRTRIRSDLDASPAEIIYGTTLRLPDEFFSDESEESSRKTFTSEFRAHMQLVKPVLTTLHQETQPFVHKNLDTCSHVFLRAPLIKKPLDHSYLGPFKVHYRPSPHYIVIKTTNKRGLVKLKTVSTLRVKPAFGTCDDLDLLKTENNPDGNFVADENIECDYTQNVPEISDDLAESTDNSNMNSQSVPENVPKNNLKSSSSKNIKPKKQVKFHLEHTYSHNVNKTDSRKTKRKKK
uniref:Uncharacterized protein n=1 Tax=Trichogramma kaykai TaxID=54128 RepID=A0ABD2X0I1_9HYME